MCRYNNIGLEVSLAKPILRSEFEKDLKLICDGLKNPQVVLEEQKQKYRRMYQNVIEKIQEIELKLEERMQEQRVIVNDTEFITDAFKTVLKCPKCANDMILKKRNNVNGYYIGCCGFPACRNAVWLPLSIEQVDISQNSCGIVSTQIIYFLK